MSKKAEEVKPNYGPVYAAAMYPELAKICIGHGYALAVHGSLARDFDLIAIPWAENVDSPEEVMRSMESKFAINRIGELKIKNHGRLCQTFCVGFGSCSLDFSFAPKL